VSPCCAHRPVWRWSVQGHTRVKQGTWVGSHIPNGSIQCEWSHGHAGTQTAFPSDASTFPLLVRYDFHSYPDQRTGMLHMGIGLWLINCRIAHFKWICNSPITRSQIPVGILEQCMLDFSQPSHCFQIPTHELQKQCMFENRIRVLQMFLHHSNPTTFLLRNCLVTAKCNSDVKSKPAVSTINTFANVSFCFREIQKKDPRFLCFQMIDCPFSN
jgi:hypothetical protein